MNTTETIVTEQGPMLVDWDVPITMSDGAVLRADVFRPAGDVQAPVLLSHGPYGKGLAFQEGYTSAWEQLVTGHPEVAEGSSNRFQNWEVADPERWVPLGYACVRVDTRGTGRSPGFLDPFSPQETQDLYDCIEWAGTQAWSTGKVGLSGISYYAMNQWQVGVLRPPHLAAICVWEGSCDHYREVSHHGGILTTFTRNWYEMQVVSVQHGNDRGLVSAVTGQRVTGDDALDEDTLRANRRDYGATHRAHAFDDEYYAAQTPDLSLLEVPLLSAGNWGGAGLHLRGNVEGFLNAGSQQKWLEMHGLGHWVEYYTKYGRDLQQRFFDHFLKGVDNGWDDQPPILLRVRNADGTFEDRTAQAWPLPDTEWTEFYLDATRGELTPGLPAAAQVTYDELGEGVTFELATSDQTLEITGPSAMTLYVSSDTDDADLFVVVRVFDPDGCEVTFPGAIDPNSPPAQGWLRASHRALDPERSLPYRPFHPHQVREPLVPGEVYEVDVEIWPTSLVLPPGYRLAVTVQGHDYEYADAGDRTLSNIRGKLRGSGPFVHDDPVDRPVYDTTDPAPAAKITLRTGGEHPARLLLPIIPR
ncbi:CocE/NonD family hydrolase [Nocardioides pocheonensis]|nr:CocE/NonD family hydrolase [Nocardioides pocheonensis]